MYTMEGYPQQHDLSCATQTMCQVAGCNKSFKQFKYLNRHLKNQHGLNVASHWLQKAEFLEKKNWGISELEADYVDLVFKEDGEVDEHKFKCVVCCKDFSKQACLKHMTFVHELGEHDVKEWVTHRDGRVLNNNKGNEAYIESHLYLSTAMFRKLVAETDYDSDEEVSASESADMLCESDPQEGGAYQQETLCDGDTEHEGDVGIHKRKDGTLWRMVWVRVESNGEPSVPFEFEELNEPLKHTTLVNRDQTERKHHHTQKIQNTNNKSQSSNDTMIKDVDRPEGSMAKLCTKMDRLEKSLLAPKDIEVVTPKLFPASIAFDWDHSSRQPRRNTCPISDEMHTDLKKYDWSSFILFLKSRKVKVKESVDSTLLAIRRFWNLLKIPKGHFHPAGVLCAVYKDDILQQLQKAPVMNQKYAWARTMFIALDHFCNFLKIECNRKRWDEAKLTLQSLQDDMIKGYKIEGVDIRKEANSDKWIEDAERLENFPTTEVMKQSVAKAMDDLICISKMAAGEHDLRIELSLSATTAVIWITYYNQFAGRSGLSSSEPTEPTEPTALAEPTKPIRPTEQTDPNAPTEPTDPNRTGPTEPTRPNRPNRPSRPSRPNRPPTEPTEPIEPTEMTEPIEATEPTEPTEPTEQVWGVAEHEEATCGGPSGER